MLSHERFRHGAYISREFSLNIWVWMELGIWPPRFDQLALPPTSELTVYSTRPLGRMAAPIPELRHPKGYLPDGYSRPADILAGQLRYGYIFKRFSTER